MGLLGPVLLLLIMIYLTIPVTEKSMKSRRPNWDEYEKETNLLWLF